MHWTLIVTACEGSLIYRAPANLETPGLCQWRSLWSTQSPAFRTQLLPQPWQKATSVAAVLACTLPHWKQNTKESYIHLTPSKAAVAIYLDFFPCQLAGTASPGNKSSTYPILCWCRSPKQGKFLAEQLVSAETPSLSPTATCIHFASVPMTFPSILVFFPSPCPLFVCLWLQLPGSQRKELCERMHPEVQSCPSPKQASLGKVGMRNRVVLTPWCQMGSQQQEAEKKQWMHHAGQTLVSMSSLGTLRCPWPQRLPLCSQKPHCVQDKRFWKHSLARAAINLCKTPQFGTSHHIPWFDHTHRAELWLFLQLTLHHGAGEMQMERKSFFVLFCLFDCLFCFLVGWLIFLLFFFSYASTK